MANEIDFVTQILQASQPQPTGPVGVPNEAELKQNALLQLGLGLMQPVQPNQTPAGHVGQVIAGALGGIQKGKMAGRAEQREQAKVDIAKGQLALGKEELGIKRQQAEAEAIWRKAQGAKLRRDLQVDQGVDSKLWKAITDSVEKSTPIGVEVDSWDVLRQYNDAALASGKNIIQPGEGLVRRIFTDPNMLQDARRIYGDAQVQLWAKRMGLGAEPAKTPGAPAAEEPKPSTAPKAPQSERYWERQRTMTSEEYQKKNQEKIDKILNFFTGGLPFEQRR